MQNKVYFTEVKPGIYKRDSKFKLKTDFVAYKQYKAFDALGWKIREYLIKKKEYPVIESMKKQPAKSFNQRKSCVKNFD